MALVSGISAVELRPGYRISTIIKGHRLLPGGPLRHQASMETLADIITFLDAGMMTIDCSDADPDLERLIGSILQDLHRSHGPAVSRSVRIHTKLTPDLSAPKTFSQEQIERTIDQSITRLGVETLDMVQLAWPNQNMSASLDGLGYLALMQAKGKVRCIGIANFDTERLETILQSGFDLAAAQVSFSLIDQRPIGEFANLCRQHNIALLAYGTLAGGFISSDWLGIRDPGYDFGNLHITRNRLIIEEFGGWDLFQELLLTLNTIAKRHRVTISSVALRAMHDHPDVTAVILQSTTANKVAGLLKAFQFSPTEQDRDALARVLSRRRGPSGPIFQLERDKLGLGGSD